MNTTIWIKAITVPSEVSGYDRPMYAAKWSMDENGEPAMNGMAGGRTLWEAIEFALTTKHLET